MNIRTRLTLQFTLMVSAIFLIAFLMIYYLRWEYVKQDFYKRLENKALTTAKLLISVEEVDANLLKKIDQTNQDVFFNENLAVYEMGGREVYTSNDSINYTLTSLLFQKIISSKKINFEEGQHQIVGIYYTDKQNQVVSIAGAEDIWGKHSLRSLSNILLSLFFFMVILVALAGWYFSGKALQPISRVIAGVKHILPNQMMHQPLPIDNPNDEIGLLTATFNELLEQLGETFRMQHLFISNVSHELKNPLMRIQTQIDVTLLKNRTNENYQDLLKSVKEDIQELGHLADTLLELAKIANESSRVIFAQVRVDEVLWEARGLLMSTLPQCLITVSIDEMIQSENQLIVNGNYHLLKTAFVNLMENGCKFSEDAHVEVQVSFGKTMLFLVFKNTGEPIADEHKKLIFQPFYRTQNTTNIKGYGIGLSLVERIIKIHGGEIQVHTYASQKQTGFTVSLPYQNLNFD